MLENHKPNAIKYLTFTEKFLLGTTIKASKNFNIKDHNFQNHAKHFIIEQFNQTYMEKSTLQKQLKVKDNFCFLTLETLHRKV